MQEAVIAEIAVQEWTEGRTIRDYISREAALKVIYTSTAPALEVKAMPAADVVERKKGEWLHQQLVPDDITGNIFGECSLCHAVRVVDNYFPNCGAEMDGGQDKAEIIYGIDMNTSTSNFTPTKRMCRQTGQMCEFAGDYGYCKITACVKRRHSKGETEHG